MNDVREHALRMAQEDAPARPSRNTATRQDPRLWRAYQMARAEIGTREIAGPASNPKIDEWFNAQGYSYKDDTAWCALFLGHMLEAAGLPSTEALNARSYEDFFEATSRPKEGDIVVFWRVRKSGWQGHVGFVVEVDWTGKRVLVLGGNQSNMVNEQWYPMNGRTVGLLGFRTLKAEVREDVQEETEMSNLIDQPTAAPTRKVTWASLAATVAAFVAPYILTQLPFLDGVIDVDVIESLLVSVLTGATTLFGGYMVRDRA